MAPEHRFPAASEDVAAVYRELLKTYKPANIGIYGCSAGGALTGEAVAWIAAQGLPRPGAAGVFCSGLMPGHWRGGDSNVFSQISNKPPGAPSPASASLQGDYFKSGKADDPLMTPGLFARALLGKFPPTLLMSGTRDVALSNVLVTHMRLRQAGVDARLIVPLDAADRWRRAGREQVIVVPLAAVVDPVAVLEEVAEAVGVRAVDVDPLPALVRRLRREPTLLVLDDAEHLTAAGPDIASLEAEVATLAVVVTSQRRLGVTGERTLPVRPLATPPPGTTDPAVLTATPAVALYLERAAAVSGPWVSPPDPFDVAELCRRLEGLPLAIELAAARAPTIGPRAMVERDDGALVDVLRQGPRDASDRHRDLRAALGWSYGLLDPDAQRLLRALALVHHPSDLDAVTALVGAGSDADVLDDLSSLVDLHLVERVGDGAFTVAPSIRTFAGDELTGAERREAVTRLVAWGTSTPDVPIGCLDDVLRLAVDESRAVDARRVLVALGPRWQAGRVRRERRALIEQVLALPTEGVPEPLRARALVASLALAPPVAAQAERDHLLAALADVEAVARDAGDDVLLLEAIGARVRLTSTLGRIEALDDLVAEATVAAARLGDPFWVARCEQWAGVLALRELDIEGAVEHGRAALRIARDLRDDTLLAHTAMFLAPLTEQRPELVADVPTLAEVLVLVRRAGLTESEVWVLPMLVDDLVSAGELERASDLTIDALELIGDRPHSAATVINLVAGVHLAAALGEDEAAARALGPIRGSVAPIFAITPPYRRERHEAAVAQLAATLGSRFDPLLRAGASVDPPEAAEQLLAVLRNRRSLAEGDGPRLTAWEREVLDLLSRGMTNKEIGVTLEVRPKTVMHHTSAIYRKLGVRGRSEAVVWAARHGLVPGSLTRICGRAGRGSGK